MSSETATNQQQPQKSIVDILTRSGAEVTHKQKQYLYKPYFPMRKYAIIAADPGTGKTKLLCGIAAKVTTGESLCGIPCQNPGNVVFFSQEDDSDDIVTTFRSCGGDVNKLTVLADEDDTALDYISKKPLFFSSRDVEEIIKAKSPSLVVFDPMQKYLPPNVDSYRNNQTSAALSYVTKLATKYNCSIVIVAHNVKMKAGLSLQAQVNGSSDIVGGSRSALAVVPFPEANERGNNVAIHVKSNNKIGKAINYKITSIEGDEDFATVQFIGLREYYESDYVKATRLKGANDENLTDNNYIVRTLLELLKENPQGFKIDKDTLTDSISEYTGQTIEVKLSDIAKQYGNYMLSKHGVGIINREGATTVSKICRNGVIIKPPEGSKRVLEVGKNPTPKIIPMKK